MTHKISLSLFLLSALRVVVCQYGCNVNEYPTQTVNPCNSCDIRSWCPENYGTACDCVPGYFRNSQGACVPPEACDGPYGTPYGKDEAYKCGENEEFHSCGTSCPATCDNPRPGSGVCIQRCVTGCFCSSGYVRDKNGKCVRESECRAPTVVPRNYYAPQPPYRPPVRPPPPVTRPPVVLPIPKPSPVPPVYPPPVRPVYPPPAPPAYPPPAKPTVIKGCPNRNLCNRNCKSAGFAVGFCVGEGFLKCNCMG